MQTQTPKKKQFSVFLPFDLAKWLEEQAEANKRSMTKQAEHIIEQAREQQGL